MSDKNEVFISVDIVTSGPIPGEYSLLTIGAVNVYEENQAFECELKPLNRKADPIALEITGLSLDELDRTGLLPKAAMSRFGGWLSGLLTEDDMPVFVGFNASFDWSFVNYYFHRFAGANPFGFAALDIKAYYMGAMGCKWSETRSSRIGARLNLQRTTGGHKALSDAMYQAELFRLIRHGRAWHEMLKGPSAPASSGHISNP
jgi:DNA polymerase III alpha subunit (gram-positive type)